MPGEELELVGLLEELNVELVSQREKTPLPLTSIKGMTKSTISEIQQAIISLSKSDYAQLRRWLNEYDWEEWDRQIEADSDDGKLNFLVDQATEARRQGTLEDL